MDNPKWLNMTRIPADPLFGECNTNVIEFNRGVFEKQGWYFTCFRRKIEFYNLGKPYLS